MPINLDVEKQSPSDADPAVYKANGKLSLETVNSFIQKMRAETAGYVIMDLSGVTFLDSAGVGALVSLFVSRRNQGKVFALAALQPQSTAVVTVAGLQNLLPIYKTVEEAAAKRA
ncbi:MAG TPA: STAS domain-containing protein [Candidatus Eremiobacteraceae bacterium]|nr:STAS domain-containing protein [Candidatus Eremiobacteraceae bacterium]